MNPAIVVAGFVVLLALLLYYMYKEKAEPAPEKPVEPSVIKVRDYEAQRAAQKPAQEPEPAEAPPTEPEVEPEPFEAEAEKPQPEPAKAAPEEPITEAMTDDLESLTGIGEKYRALLRAAGVRSIATLADEAPDALLDRLTETNETEEIVKRLPSADEVETWVQTAKQRGA